MHDDIISDILGRIAARCAPVALAQIDLTAIEMEVRRDWGGDRAYIAKLGEAGIAARIERDERIRLESRRLTVRELATRHSLSPRRIREILADGGGALA